MDEIATIGERLRKVRRRLGMTQKEFAEALGVHPMTLSKYESGKWKPSEKFLRLLEAKFGINYDWLLYGRGTMFNFGFQAVRQRTDAIAKLLDLAEMDIALKVLTDKIVESIQHDEIIGELDKKLVKILKGFIYKRLVFKVFDIYSETLTQLAIQKANEIDEKALTTGGTLATRLLKQSAVIMLDLLSKAGAENINTSLEQLKAELSEEGSSPESPKPPEDEGSSGEG
jgi:transcriptional regulator with XRE-family HTH domain